MYIAAALPTGLFLSEFEASSRTGALYSVRSLLESEEHPDWVDNVLRTSWTFILYAVNTFVSWVVHVGPSWAGLSQALVESYTFVQRHPHPFHALGWSIFFGPIILLVPCLLAIEILILVLFLLSFMSHGFVSGPIEDRFDALKDYFMDWRESLFATVELSTAAFNKWTVDFPALLIFRVIAGAFSLFILVGIWSGLT